MLWEGSVLGTWGQWHLSVKCLLASAVLGVRRTPGQGKAGSLFDDENRESKDYQILDLDGAVNFKPRHVLEAMKLKSSVFRDRGL